MSIGPLANIKGMIIDAIKLKLTANNNNTHTIKNSARSMGEAR